MLMRRDFGTDCPTTGPRGAAVAMVLGLANLLAGCQGGQDQQQRGYTLPPESTASTGTVIGSGGAASSSSVSSMSSTSVPSTNVTGGIVMTTGGEGTGGGSFEDCEADISVAESIGLDMFIVFDRSGSMALRPPPNDSDRDRIAVPEDAVLGDCPVDLVSAPAQDSKWCMATNALARFFTSATSFDVRAALQFMTPANPDSYQVCGAGLDNPHAVATVPYAPLPVDGVHALVSALDLETPHIGNMNGVGQAQIGTRIEAALNGIASFTAGNADPERKTIGVLITDGDPVNCDEEPANLAQIAATHLAATGIQTFVIGMTGATAANLETIAIGGGGPEHGPEYCESPDTSCHYWSVAGGDPQAFAEVLSAIQESVFIACEYAIPDTGPGETLDPNLVAVTYNDGSGAEPAGLPRVADVASCDAALGGWYYDDPQAPGSIVLCPASCDAVSLAPSGAQVEILYGCVEQIL